MTSIQKRPENRIEVAPYTCFMQDKNDSADLNSAHHGQIQDKEKSKEGSRTAVFLVKAAEK